MSNISEEMQISDPYFMAYHILSTALRSKNMHEDIPKTLYMAKLFFNADDVILYKQNENGDYIHKYNSALMSFNPALITTCLILWTKFKVPSFLKLNSKFVIPFLNSSKLPCLTIFSISKYGLNSSKSTTLFDFIKLLISGISPISNWTNIKYLFTKFLKPSPVFSGAFLKELDKCV